MLTVDQRPVELAANFRLQERGALLFVSQSVLGEGSLSLTSRNKSAPATGRTVPVKVQLVK